jgi:hypothetical protein
VPDMKPPLLRAVVALLCMFNLAGFAFVQPAYGMVAIQVLLALAIILVSFVVIWRFWAGSRLSRILVLITSGVAILNLRLPSECCGGLPMFWLPWACFWRLAPCLLHDIGGPPELLAAPHGRCDCCP